MAIRPNTGERPRNTADDSAASTPLLCRLLLAMPILSLYFSRIACADITLFYMRIVFETILMHINKDMVARFPLPTWDSLADEGFHFFQELIAHEITFFA